MCHIEDAPPVRDFLFNLPPESSADNKRDPVEDGTVEGDLAMKPTE